ncbi:uncharacterized protein LOC120892823 [Ictidomys tridecemlineatus]
MKENELLKRKLGSTFGHLSSDQMEKTLQNFLTGGRRRSYKCMDGIKSGLLRENRIAGDMICAIKPAEAKANKETSTWERRQLQLFCLLYSGITDTTRTVYHMPLPTESKVYPEKMQRGFMFSRR